MTEKDACLAIENTVEQLEQAPAIGEETHKLKSLKPGFRTMRHLVEELDGQKDEPYEWLQQVRHAAYEAQDVIGSVVADTNLQKQKSKLGRLLSGGKATKHVEEIENMKERIERICSSKDVASSKKEFSRGHSFFKTNFVGFQDAKETLVRQLIDVGKPQRDVILILGKAGSGKTTLAKMVYNDDRINEHFSCQVWVSFTQEQHLEEMLCSILKQTSSSSNQIDSLSKDDLKLELCKTLKGKRYLIAIDNVHNHDVVREVVASFPDELNQSRILIASQVTQADLRGQHSFSFSYTVQPLDANQSWQLFSSKVFEGGNSANLESLGRQLTKKCKGSPGAIMALAATLKGAEKTEEMWSKFLDGNYDLLNFSSLSKELQLCLRYLREQKTEEMWSKFTKGYDDIDDIRMTFQLLHKDLQFCLLYFGLIPEGLKMPAKQMIQMWMAEGLLKQRGNKRPEEIGEQYLKKLINVSFIQVKRSPYESAKTWGTSCNVYHFCRTEGVNWKFSEVHKDNLKPQKDIPRMAVHSDSVTDVLKSFGNCSHVHSLHCFGQNTTSMPIRSAEFWRTLHQNFQNLQVLNLGFLELEKVPKELGKMTNLRYLRLKAPNVKHLPYSIVNLHWLETLDMRESHFVSLPNGIWKMKLLRHLYFGGSAFLPNTRGIDYYKTLPNLQTLSGVQPDKELKWLLVRAKFPNVTRLRICSFDSKLTLNFLNSLDHLYHLQSLRIENPIKLPDTNAFPLNLTKLTLLKTKLHQECIKTIGELPSLRILKLLEEAIHGNVIESSGGFLQLEFLHVENLIVENWKLEKGAMQGVKRFSIKGHGIDLESVPGYLRDVAFKQEVERTEPVKSCSRMQ